MIEAVIIAVAAALIALVWHVHKMFERLEAIYAINMSLFQNYMESLYSLMQQLEQYAIAVHYQQHEDGVRYA